MAWRLPPKVWNAQKGSRNRAALRRIVAKGPPPGMLAYDGVEPVGWCAIAPRESYLHLSRSRVLQPMDATPVWSVSCLFVRKEYRRRGVATALLRSAAQFAYRRGAPAVEGYPVIPYSDSMPAAFAWTGTVANFKAAGFHEVARNSAKRPIMRRYRSN
jgi:GNAT superfamily N-acetyltransferase